MVRTALLVAFALTAARDPSCGSDTTGGSINAPCTRPGDCADGLVCSGGVCGEVDAGAPSDASADTTVETGDE